MPNHSEIPVLIVGGGAVGSVLSMELARRGIEYRCIERMPGPGRESRAIAMHARTVELFDLVDKELSGRILDRDLWCKGYVMHFVRDGHHRVSVARALGDKDINAHVIDVRTKLGVDPQLSLGDLPLKRHERVFHERVPLMPEQAERIQLSDEWRYAQLATLVESWGYRASLDRDRLLGRREMAQAWFTEDYEPLVAVLRELGLGGGGTETERYLRISMLRFLLLQTHDWTDEIAERLSGEVRSPSPAAEKDTMTHQILKELRD